MLCGIRAAQLSSAIVKRLNKFELRRPSIHDILDTMAELEDMLQKLRASFPAFLSTGLCSPQVALPASVHADGFLFLLFTYHASVILVHSILVYPWNTARLRVTAAERSSLESQIAQSSEKCVGAARIMLQQLSGVNITPSTPKS